MNLTLQRAVMSDACTQGAIALPDGSTLYSLELPWVPERGYPGGHPNRSCVPAGLYDLALHDTVKHPRSFALVNVALGVVQDPDPEYPNYRSDCLVHVANIPEDLEGCVGIGLTRLNCFVGDSALAMAKFRASVPWVVGHTLMIVDP